MAKYLFRVGYTREGVAGVLKEGGSARRDAVVKAMASAGGTVESFYFAFGDDDVFVIADLPSDVAATAVGLVVNASGGAKATTVCLLTPEQVDQAQGLVGDTTYRAPGA